MLGLLGGRVGGEGLNYLPTCLCLPADLSFKARKGFPLFSTTSCLSASPLHLTWHHSILAFFFYGAYFTLTYSILNHAQFYFHFSLREI